MTTFTFDTADVAATPSFSFGVLTITVDPDRADVTRQALATLGFTVNG